MTKEELKKWFWSKFNSCYQVRDGDYVYYYYDEVLLRNKKICRAFGRETSTTPKEVKGEIYFKLDLKNKTLYCNYEHVWSVFYKKNLTDHQEVKSFIKNILKEHDKISDFTPEHQVE